MLTYYAAQLGFALSVVDSKASYKDMIELQRNSTLSRSSSRSPSPAFSSRSASSSDEESCASPSELLANSRHRNRFKCDLLATVANNE